VTVEAAPLADRARQGDNRRPEASQEGRMSESRTAPMRRRDLLALIGTTAGSAVMYRAMTSLSLAAESDYAGPIKLDGDPRGASVLILGAGLAGMVAALELRKAGYRVQVLEYSNRAGGRCWTLRGGDTYTARWRNAALRLCARPLPQSGSVAHSLSPSCAARLLQAPQGRARAVHPSQYQRVPAFARRFRRQAATLSACAGRLQRLCLGAARQGGEPA